MTEKNQALLEKLYQQYINPVKPLIAEIESLYEAFPLPIHNEIRALNDHVARAYCATTDEEAEKQIGKAGNHLDRIIRDCYKFLNVYFREEAEKFNAQLINIEPRSQKEYALFADYGELSDAASKMVQYAKDNEHMALKDETYENFQKAYHAYEALHEFIVKNRRDVFSMSIREKKRSLKTAVISVATFIIGCVITNNNAVIIKFFQHLLPLN